MITQIYTAQSPEEAVALAELGVDHVGLTPADIGLPGEISIEVAAKCAQAIRGKAKSSALSVSANLDEISAMVEVVRPDILHLCGLPGDVPPHAVAQLRGQIGDVKIMQAIAMSGPESLEEAQAYAPYADMLILDSVAPSIAGVGAAGETHDWSLSARIVREVNIPVILAGGLSPNNVQEAIGVVAPWGVDSLTATNQQLSEGGFRKDLKEVAAFVQAAVNASMLEAN